MSVHELLYIFIQKINLADENKNKIFFIFQGSMLRYDDHNNILKANLFNGSMVTVIDVNNSLSLLINILTLLTIFLSLFLLPFI